MARTILVIGESGTGKSASCRNINPEKTLYIRMVNKDLPFKGWKKGYIENKNLFTLDSITSSLEKIGKLRSLILRGAEKFENIIIDDSQYIMSYEFMSRASEKGYNKFSEIACNFWNVVQTAIAASGDCNIVFLHHSDLKETGNISIKTIGKMLDDKISLEGVFTYILHAVYHDEEYRLLTNRTSNYIAKTPMGMFEDIAIDNDLQLVFNAIKEYEK